VLYQLVPRLDGTEGRIRGFQVEHQPHVIDVSRKTYTYERDPDGSFSRLPEQWVGEGRDFGNFADAMSFVLHGWFTKSGPFLVGDTIWCQFEGIHHEWTLWEDGGSFSFQEISWKQGEKS